MIIPSYVNPRSSDRTLFRSRPLATATVALAATLALVGCGGAANDFSGGDVDLALKALQASTDEGFAQDQFGQRRIASLLASKDPKDRADGRRDLRSALAAYARAEHGLAIPKSAMPADWGLKAEPFDAEASLAQALQKGAFREWLVGLRPSTPAYGVLQTAYVAYRKVQGAGGWPTLASGPQLKLGGQGPQVAALRARLAYEDPQVAHAPSNAGFDAELAGAVQRFQATHGLQPTGLVDAPTLQELNVPAESRAAQIRANLERLRWLPRTEPASRIDVNIAAATMSYFVDGKLTTHMLAASGRPGDETPMLASAVDAIVLNPPWNVPQTIADAELRPKGEAYLQREGFVTKDGPDGPRLVQRPGPDAALGLVKFDFDNPYAVYLHDTPAKAAFARSQRAVSHGCVRLAQAVDFAKLLLSSEPGWSAARVDQTLASGETTRVTLTRPVAVRLLYQTAFPEGDRIAFRPDIYGWDAKLLQLLDNPKNPAATKPGHRT